MSSINKRKYIFIFSIFLILGITFYFSGKAVFADNSQIEHLRQILLEYRNRTLYQNSYVQYDNFGQRCGIAEIKWQKVSGATEYKLFRNGVLAYQGKNTEFKDEGLITGLTYIYTISAGNKGGFGQESNPQFITVPMVCPPQFAPSLFILPGRCGGEIVLSWSYVPGATKYELFRGKTKIYDGQNFNFTDKVKAGSSNTYTIKAVNSGGESEMSGQMKATASLICPPGAPLWQEEERNNNTGGFVVLSASKQNKQTLKENAKNRIILTFKAEAEDSDITVERVGFSFTERPWLYFEKMDILDGGKVVKEITVTESSFSSVSRDQYIIWFNDLNIKVAKDKTKNIALRVTVKERLSRDIDMQVYVDNRDVRSRDNTNYIMQEPANGGKDSLFSRNLQINR